MDYRKNNTYKFNHFSTFSEYYEMCLYINIWAFPIPVKETCLFAFPVDHCAINPRPSTKIKQILSTAPWSNLLSMIHYFSSLSLLIILSNTKFTVEPY